MCKAVPQTVFRSLQVQATSVRPEEQIDVLRLLLDLLVNVPRSVTTEYGERLAWWATNMVDVVVDEECQMVLTDVIVYCIEYLYKSDCKRSHSLVDAFYSAGKSVKRSRRCARAGLSGNRLDALLPELKGNIAEYLRLPCIL
jgi:hypothetical protein